MEGAEEIKVYSIIKVKSKGALTNPKNRIKIKRKEEEHEYAESERKTIRK